MRRITLARTHQQRVCAHLKLSGKGADLTTAAPHRGKGRRQRLPTHSSTAAPATTPHTYQPGRDPTPYHYSEARTENLRQTEKWAFITFVATAPLAYGLFWYVGILDDVTKSFSRERAASEGDDDPRAIARARVDALMGTPPQAPSTRTDAATK